MTAKSETIPVGCVESPIDIAAVIRQSTYPEITAHLAKTFINRSNCKTRHVFVFALNDNAIQKIYYW